MEIKNNTPELLKPDLNTKQLLPEFQNLNHFFVADNLDLTPIKAMKEAEDSWREIENFEFQKMDIDASFEKLIKRV